MLKQMLQPAITRARSHTLIPSAIPNQLQTKAGSKMQRCRDQESMLVEKFKELWNEDPCNFEVVMMVALYTYDSVKISRCMEMTAKTIDYLLKTDFLEKKICLVTLQSVSNKKESNSE